MPVLLSYLFNIVPIVSIIKDIFCYTYIYIHGKQVD